MAKLLPDELWAIIEPLLPRLPPAIAEERATADHPPLGPHRHPVVLKAGLPWEDLPAEVGCCRGMSCWRRLAAWQADGTWEEIHAALLERLDNAGRLDWSKAVIDSSSVRAVFGGRHRPEPPPTAGRTATSTTC